MFSSCDLQMIVNKLQKSNVHTIIIYGAHPFEQNSSAIGEQLCTIFALFLHILFPILKHILFLTDLISAEKIPNKLSKFPPVKKPIVPPKSQTCPYRNSFLDEIHSPMNAIFCESVTLKDCIALVILGDPTSMSTMAMSWRRMPWSSRDLFRPGSFWIIKT